MIPGWQEWLDTIYGAREAPEVKALPVRTGVSDAPRVPCARFPENHGFRPQDEGCPYCDE